MAWYQEKKSKVSGPKLKCGGLNPVILLYRAGYVKLPNGSFIHPLDKTHRFHAYILGGDTIELHTDLFKPHHNGITYHVASTFRCKPERKRLSAILADNFPKKNKPKREFANEVLPRDKMEEALKNL